MLAIFSHDAFFQKYGGISRCVVELVRHIGIAGHACRVYAGLYGNLYLRELATETSGSTVTIEGRWSNSAPGRIASAFRNELGLAKRVRAAGSPVVHRTYYPVIDLLPSSVPVVVTLHDMYWEAQGLSHSLRFRMHSWLKRRALRRADRIVCISRFTLDELARIWPELVDKCAVVYHGVRPLAATPDDVPEVSDQFIFVGDRAGRKNFGMALAGLATSGLVGNSLVCVGGGPFTTAETTMIDELGLTSRVVQQDADDAALTSLYRTAVAMVYPSTYEGFGMPLLEAMLNGCPVIAARASCLPEIAGDAALYADPDDAAEWGERMRESTQTGLRGALAERGRERAASSQFSWDAIAAQYVEIYRDCRAVGGEAA